jgi:hypothetical protein
MRFGDNDSWERSGSPGGSGGSIQTCLSCFSTIQEAETA